MTTVTIPQPVMPFAIGPDGFPGICEQGSAQDIASKALTFLSCPQGANPYNPEFGLPAQLFGRLPLNVTAIKAALAEYMPEMLDVTVSQVVDGVIAQLNVTGYVEGS